MRYSYVPTALVATSGRAADVADLRVAVYADEALTTRAVVGTDAGVIDGAVLRTSDAGVLPGFESDAPGPLWLAPLAGAAFEPVSVSRSGSGDPAPDMATDDEVAVAAAGGGAGVGAACWFEIPAPLGAGVQGDIPWEPQLDGVAPFTDAAVGDDPTHIVIVNGGAWRFNVVVSVNNVTGEAATNPKLFVARGDDSVGPLYNLGASIPVPAVENDFGTGGLSFDIDLADGEYIIATVNQLPGFARVNDANLSCRRLGPVAPAVLGEGVVFADSFNRVNGVLTAPWVTRIGTGFETISNEAGCSDNTPQASTVDAGTDDYAVAVDVPNVSAGVAVIVRYTDADNYLRVLMTGAVQDVVDGAATTIGNLSAGFVLNGDRLTVAAVGDTVTVDRNGVEEMAGTTTILVGSECGLLSIGDEFSRFDNFEVRTLP